MRAKNVMSKRGRNPWANRPHPRGMAGKTPWNRGLTWEAMYAADVLQRQEATRTSRIQSAQRALAASDELEQQRREKSSRAARERGLGGYERGSGRGKKDWYRGYWCDSNYELAFVVWPLDHEIPFERNTRVSYYEFGGKVMRWIPDFLLADGTFVEIKGYVTEQTLAKFRFFLPSVLVLTRTELSPMCDYVGRRMCGISRHSMSKIAEPTPRKGGRADDCDNLENC